MALGGDTLCVDRSVDNTIANVLLARDATRRRPRAHLPGGGHDHRRRREREPAAGGQPRRDTYLWGAPPTSPAFTLECLPLHRPGDRPFLKYPANPPAVGNPDTIGKRTTLYFLMMLLSVLLAIAATIPGKRLAPSLGAWWATVIAVVAFALVIGLAYAFLPVINEVPKDFPATVLWRFRLSALAIQLTLWTGFGLLFGELAERLLNPKPATAVASGRRPVAAPN
ncbi:CbtA family protein [Streptomyces griseofuscus]|uniref:CbtA family protein n=1 Tax=Streptomyces griseofuscus TaxID=146922 RepID=UPI0036962565